MKLRVPLLVAAAIGLLAFALWAAGASPVGAVRMMLQGSLGSPSAVSNTLREATPLLLAGLAVFVALRAGLFNIGVEGQLLVGALACAATALKLGGPSGLVAGTLVGALFGALWALPAGLIKAYRQGHEVITTIMMNSVAGFLTAYLVSGPLKDPQAGEATTSQLDRTSWLPPIVQGPLTVSAAIPIGLVLAFALSMWLRRTVAGYELQATGTNPTAARFGGVDTKATIVRAMLASGAFAGLAGAVQVLAYEHRFYQEFSPGYGFDALGVALLAGSNALGVIPSSLLFGILARGGTVLAIEGIPKGITTVILGLMILVAAAVRYRKVTADA